MIRLGTLFWAILVVATGFVMFTVKYEVQNLEGSYARTEKTIADTQQQIRVLEADWAYLNRPDTLAQLNQRYLSLVPIATKELRLSVADIPMRPEPPPADDGAAPPAAVAASPAPAAPAAPPPATVAALPPAPASPPPVVKAVLRTAAAHRLRSLDELFSEVAARR